MQSTGIHGNSSLEVARRLLDEGLLKWCQKNDFKPKPPTAAYVAEQPEKDHD